MTFLEPSDKTVNLSDEDKKFIYEEWQKLIQDNKHWDVYRVLGMEPNTVFKYHTHSDPNFNFHFADNTLFPFGIKHSDDALLILAGLIESGYFNMDTGHVELKCDHDWSSQSCDALIGFNCRKCGENNWHDAINTPLRVDWLQSRATIKFSHKPITFAEGLLLN